MPSSRQTDALLVCTGKDCRHDTGHRDLLALARQTAGSSEVPCQSLCNGPVAGCRVDGELRWFTKVRSPKKRAALIKLLRTGRVPKRLRGREARKRRGELRGGRKVRPLSAP